MGRVPDHVVSEVRDRADLVAIVSRHIALRRVGTRHWGLCPFHDEKTSSFQVHEDKQIFYCFGCGAGGDVFAFRMRQENLDFPEAIRALARELGIAIPEDDSGAEGRTAALYRVNEIAAAFFRAKLRTPEAAAARRYLDGRGTPAELLERFQVGYAPNAWDALARHLEREKVAPADAERAGLIAKRTNGPGHYDRFRDRILFPIIDPSGQIIGFGGRLLQGDGPKYLNTPETPVYKKSQALFGLPQAVDAMRETGRAIVVEGYFDLVALHRAGIFEGVAPCGTALTAAHARRLRRYAKEIVLLFDGDRAGKAAAERALPTLLQEGVRVRAAFLPSGEDPDTLVSKGGGKELRACVDAAVPLLDFLIERAVSNGWSTAWASADATRELAQYLVAIPEPVERAAYVRQIASRLEVPVTAVEAAIQISASAKRPAPEAPALAPDAPIRIDPVACALLCALAACPEVEPKLGELEPAELEGLAGFELLVALRGAISEHGMAAVRELISEGDSTLTRAQKDALMRVLAEAAPTDARTAERAAADAVAKIRARTHAQASKHLTAQIAASCDRDQETRLLEEKQLEMSRRAERTGNSHPRQRSLH